VRAPHFADEALTEIHACLLTTASITARSAPCAVPGSKSGSPGAPQSAAASDLQNARAVGASTQRRVVLGYQQADGALQQRRAEAARAQWRQVADQLGPKLPELAAFMDEAEVDVLAYMSFPA
jgi:hypothetical protein